jgi:hypothetical protein
MIVIFHWEYVFMPFLILDFLINSILREIVWWHCLQMMFLHKSFILHLFVIFSIVSSFSPDTSSFDAYGLKLAANDVLLVESLPSASSFLLRLAPYNYSFSCTIAYNDSNQYVYTVALHSQATYVVKVKPSQTTVFPCVGWQASNYRIHQFQQFISDGTDESTNNNFFIVTVG